MDAALIVLVYVFAAFVLLVSLTAIFGPWLSFAIKGLALTGKNVFFHQLSRQLTRLNLWFAALFSFMVLGALFSGYLKLKQALPPTEVLEDAAQSGLVLPPPMQYMLLLAAYFLLFVLLLALANFAWKSLRAKPILHFILLGLAAFAGSAALVMAFATVLERPQILNTYYFLSIFPWTVSMFPFGVPTTASSSLMIAKMLSGGFGLAAAMSLCGLLIFRKRDEFGRDYYNFAVRHLSLWCLVCTVVTLASGLGMMLFLRNLSSGVFNLEMQDIILVSLIYLSCVIFYATLLRSPTPLRHKPGMWISLVALVVGMLGHLIYVRSFFIATGLMPGLFPMS